MSYIIREKNITITSPIELLYGTLFQNKEHYNISLVERLIKIITLACQNSSKVRLATLEMSILVLKQLVYRNGRNFLQDRHLALLEGAKEESTLLLRNFYKVFKIHTMGVPFTIYFDFYNILKEE